jgi:sec-independent protein translocase protein TatA
MKWIARLVNKSLFTCETGAQSLHYMIGRYLEVITMFEGLAQPLHLILIFLIVLVIFGPGKLPELGESLGKSIKAFKKAVQDEAINTVPPHNEKKRD